MKARCVFALVGFLSFGCSPENDLHTGTPQAREIIDLGALVTEDLTLRVWGKRLPRERGFDRPNVFEVIHWSSGPIEGQNSYYTLFNHGGPHVDAPIHMGFEGGIDDYAVDAFFGPLKVFDVSHLPFGRSVGVGVFQAGDIQPGDIVMIYTDYRPPASDDEYPRVKSLTPEAAEYLAGVPVRAFATDAWSVEVGPGDRPTEPTTEPALHAPSHHAFLTRGIPVFEQLFNVKSLLEEKNMLFVGQPLNISGGDGMIVRPLVFVY